MKTPPKLHLTLYGIVAGLTVAATALTVWSQTTPVLTIAQAGTNQFSITLTNNIGTNDYDLLWTPVLDSQNYPWSYAAVGTPGGTNFLLNTAGYPSGFFRAVLDTNAVPLWEAANPNNPASGILKVMIINPANAEFSFSANPYQVATRFTRGDRNDLNYLPMLPYNSFVLPLDLEKGVRLNNFGNDAYCYGAGAPWFLNIQKIQRQHVLQLTSGTTNVTRFPVDNPIVAFGKAAGGSPLYVNQPYRFGLFGGA